MPVDENRLISQRSKGLKTQRLWDDPTIQGFFTEIEDEIRTGWLTSQSEERERREEIYYLHRAVDALKQKFKSYIGTGKLASKQLDEIEKEKRGDG